MFWRLNKLTHVFQYLESYETKTANGRIQSHIPFIFKPMSQYENSKPDAPDLDIITFDKNGIDGNHMDHLRGLVQRQNQT